LYVWYNASLVPTRPPRGPDHRLRPYPYPYPCLARHAGERRAGCRA